MSGKIISFWEYCKLKFHRTMDNTRGEYDPRKVNNANEYVINGVRYIVSTKHSKTESMTFIDKIKRYLGSDFAHLTTAEDINTINTECVCMTAGKED